MQEFTAFSFFKARNTLPSGNYKVVEDDGTINIAMIDSFGCVEWKEIEDFERYEHEQMEDLRWANDGMDMVLGGPDDSDYL